MRHGYNNDLVHINDINDVVPKRAQPELAYAISNCSSRQRVRRYECDCILQVLLEAITETITLRVEVCDSFVDLELRSLQEPRTHHFLRDRSRAKSSSAEIDSISPALYAA